MSFISGLSNAIAKVPVPKTVQRVFLATSREGAAAIVPLEASVTVGRTVAETVRSGFLGFQERLPEEAAAAFIWLWGVSLLQKLFDKLKPIFFPWAKHLSGDIAWNLPGKKKSVDLTAQELFTRDAQEMRKLLQIKSFRWLFSVGLALAGVAVVVPKLNQWKTNFILKHFYEGKSLEPNTGEITPSGVGRPTSSIVSAGVSNRTTLTNSPSSGTPASQVQASSHKHSGAFHQTYQPNPSHLSTWVSSSPKQLNHNSALEGPPSLDPNRGAIVPSGVGRPTSSIVSAGVSNRATLSNGPSSATSASKTENQPPIQNQPVSFHQTYQSNPSPGSTWVSSAAIPNQLNHVSPLEGPPIEPNTGSFVPSGLGRPLSSIVSAEVSNRATLSNGPSSATSAFSTQKTAPFLNGSRSNFTPTANNRFNTTSAPAVGVANLSTSLNTSQPVHFGFVSMGMGNVLQSLGHAVEQTPYGSILVVDNGIVVGRAAVAKKRSPYEAIEVVFRDIASLYFYILFAPHVMALFSKAVNPRFQTHIQLQPQLAESMTQSISDGLADRAQQWINREQDPIKRAEIQQAFEKGAVPTSWVKELLLGSQNQLLLQPTDSLKAALRISPFEGPQGFLSVFHKEMKTYHWANENTAQWETSILQRLQSKDSLTSETLNSLLTEIRRGQAPFSTLSKAQRNELTVALKSAFRHTAGIPVNGAMRALQLNSKGLAQSEHFSSIWGQLSSDEQADLAARIARLGQIDNLDQVNTMFRRSLNLLREPLGEHSSLMREGESLSSWIDQAVNRRLTLSELLEQTLEELQAPLQKQGLLVPGESLTPQKLSELVKTLKNRPSQKTASLFNRLNTIEQLLDGVTPNQPLDSQIRERINTLIDTMVQQVDASSRFRPILNQYRDMLLERLQHNRGQLFSLTIDTQDPTLDAKLKELLVGGLQHDSSFLKKAQGTMGNLITDSKLFNSRSNEHKIQASMQQYGEKLLNHLEQEAQPISQNLPKLVQWQASAEFFQKLNRNLNYIGRLISMGGAMLCLGILVPKLQYGITRKLTGKNENPGIASAEHAIGIKT